MFYPNQVVFNPRRNVLRKMIEHVISEYEICLRIISEWHSDMDFRWLLGVLARYL
jgi:hypothetical protein